MALLDLAKVSALDFHQLVGATFVASLDGRRVDDFKLVEVEEGSPSPGHRTPFSLLFSGSPTTGLPQAVYDLSGPAIGDLQVFLVPIGEDMDGRTFQAVFG